ncbi:MAG TPA: hypothetical protein VF727_03960 [Allosphingosinicella sp.]
MRPEDDAMMVVRAELCDRLATLRAMAARGPGRNFAENVDGIRRLAAAYGLEPVARLAEALERAIGESVRSDPRCCPTALYLSRLEDAIGCQHLDEEASQAILASVAVRFGG